MKTKSAVTTIDEYLANVSAEQGAALEKLRKQIKAAAPGAEEYINYGIAAFRLDGKAFAGFGASAKHCSYYPMSGSTLSDFKKDLKGFVTSKGAIQFQPDKPLPAALVKKLVKTRIAENAKKRPASSIKKTPIVLTHLTNTEAAKRRGCIIDLVEELPEAAAKELGQHLSLEVRGRRFAWFLEDHHGDGRMALHCKTQRGECAKLVAANPERFHIPKYVGAHGWVGLWLDLPGIDWAEVANLLADAYRMTAPKKLAVRI